MDSEIDEEFLKFYKKLFKIFLKIKNSLGPAFRIFNNDSQMSAIEKILKETEKEFDQAHPKIERKIKKCVFFGETSSGKSSLINAILGGDVLPENFESLLTCFVEIKSIPPNRPNNKNYLIVDGEEKDTTIFLNQLNNSLSENSLLPGSHIDLFFDSENFSNIRNVILIDTPGIDKAILTNVRVEDYCNDADMIVIVVNCTSWSNNPIIEFCDRLKQCLTKYTVAIVYNLSEKIDKNTNSENMKSHCIETARDVLCRILEYSDEEANARIHFLSASERILFNRNDKDLRSSDRWQSRNEAFDRFNGFLQKHIKKSSFMRRYDYVCQLKNKLISVLNECRSVVYKIERSNDITGLKEEIKDSANSIFSLAFDKFIEGAVEIMRNVDAPRSPVDVGSWNYNYIEKANEILKYAKELGTARGSQVMNNILDDLLREIMRKSKADLKKKIKECIRRTNYEYVQEKISIVENIYFRLYIDKILIVCEEKDIVIFNNLGQKIKRKSGKMIVIGALVGGAVVGGAAAIPVILGASILVLVSGFALGAVIGGTAAIRLLKGLRKPFQDIWKNDIEPIREAWKIFVLEIISSYDKFLNESRGKLVKKCLPLNEEIIRIQSDLDNLNNQIIHFQNIAPCP